MEFGLRVKLGNYHFDSIENIKAQVRTTLKRSLQGLSPDDRAFLESLVAHHPDYSERSAGLADLHVASHPTFQHTPSLFLRRADGTSDDISLNRCIKAIRAASTARPL